MSLTSPPEDCLREIIFQTASECLPALELTCQTLHRDVTPHLYRFVYFWESGYRGYTFHFTQSLEWPRAICRVTRIFILPQFLQTMGTCPKLKARVLSASFDWQQLQKESCGYGKDEKDENIYHALAVLPSSAFIHICPAQFMMRGIKRAQDAY